MEFDLGRIEELGNKIIKMAEEEGYTPKELMAFCIIVTSKSEL